MRVKSLVHTLAKPFPYSNAKIPFYTLGDVKAEALRDILTDTLAEAKAVTLGDTLGNVEGKTLD